MYHMRTVAAVQEGPFHVSCADSLTALIGAASGQEHAWVDTRPSEQTVLTCTDATGKLGNRYMMEACVVYDH